MRNDERLLFESGLSLRVWGFFIWNCLETAAVACCLSNLAFCPALLYLTRVVSCSSGSARLYRLWTLPVWVQAPAPVQAPAVPRPPPCPPPRRCRPPAHTNARCQRCLTTPHCLCLYTTSRWTTAASSESVWTWRTETCTKASWWGNGRCQEELLLCTNS